MKFSRADMKRSVILDADWYQLVVTKAYEEPSKDKKSTNTVVELEVQSNDKRVNGVPIRYYINEKMQAMGVELAKALGGDLDPDEGGEFEFDDSIEGKVVQAYIEPEIRGNTTYNTPKQWAPEGEDV